jgi:uncharacterized surface protein with fasciclin (FAS1) repeats
LVDTLNNAYGITVLAPTNGAFVKWRAKAALEIANVRTLQRGTIATAKSGDTDTANDARVLCGNVPTRNDTGYLIDTVWMPKG